MRTTLRLERSSRAPSPACRSARRVRSRRPLFVVGASFAALALGALALPESAEAYCRTASCPNKTIGAQCVPAKASDCGIPIFWPTPCTGFTIQKDATPGIDAKTVESLAKQAFASWTQADCGGGQHPKMRVDDLGLVTCAEPEYNQQLANSNTIMFRSKGWPYPQTNTLALTTVTFNLDTGEIRDADMEINSTDQTFSTSDSVVTFDLLSILTHETGHFLGLAHSPAPGATMTTDYPPKSTSLRSLDQDDIDAICAVYPPGTVPETCDSTPRGGLGDECKSPLVDGTTQGCCAVAPGSRTGLSEAEHRGADAALGALAIGVVAALARRRRRPSSPR